MPYPRRTTLNEKDLLLLESLANGGTAKSAAKVLGVSPNTIRDRMGSIFRITNTTSATQAVAYAFRKGLIV